MIRNYQYVVNTPMHFFAENCYSPLISSQSIGIIELMTEHEHNRLAEAARWVKELNETVGLPFKAIAEKAGIPYTTLLYVKNRSGSDITSDVYNAIHRLYLERFPSPQVDVRDTGRGLAVGIQINDDSPPRGEIKVPSSASDFYGNFEFHGGKVAWLELDDETRSFYENLHSFLLHAIDSANEKYAASLRELRAARDKEIRAAMEEFEKTFRKRMLGILGN